jgi:hypothetical protein
MNNFAIMYPQLHKDLSHRKRCDFIILLKRKVLL